MSQTEDQILEKLKAVMDPDLGRDIVSLGFIKNLKVEEGTASFDIELTTPACPIKDRFREQAEQLALEVDGVSQVKINMTSRKMTPAPNREETELKDIRHIIAVSSCKGGVGKSTVAANLALALKETGAEVGLLDADVFGPSQPALLMAEDFKPSIEHDRFKPVEPYGIKMMSAAYLFPPGEAAVLRGPMVSNVLQQILMLTRWGRLDYLVIDMPPGTGDVQLSISQLAPLSGSVIVTTPQKIALMDVEKGIKMFSKVNVPILGVVENMSFYQCDKCGERTDLYGPSGVDRMCEQFGVQILGRIPFQPEVIRDSDQGIPPVTDKTSKVRQYYLSLAEDVVRRTAMATYREDDVPQVDFEWKGE